MAADVLGEGWSAETIPLPPDDEGEVVATLVQRDDLRGRESVALYVHGYNDYFFQAEHAAEWAEWGYDFAALDLRKCGRSLRPGQTPSYVRHLGEYAPELDEALRRLRADGARRIVVVGHSTGGLVAALWLHHRRGTDRAAGVVGLVLNSPFLDLAGTAPERVRASVVGAIVGRVRPHAVVPHAGSDAYARSLHRELDGEWTYDLAWKAPGGLPLRAGWLRAVREGHRAVRRCLDVDVPVLALTSRRSLRAREWHEDARAADVVLDADRVAGLAPRLGSDVTVVRIDGGLHDLVLSGPDVRARVHAEVGAWLARRLEPPPPAPPAAAHTRDDHGEIGLCRGL